ncbi:MAG: TIGR01906 family membrane protein [Anaerolineae bacterium]|nr:TIGR01906 family membrane protein [Anaerolineae bacterium]
MIARIAPVTLALLVPLLLLMLAIRLVMTPLYLQIEYQRAGFPADSYGMTTAQRLEYAPLTLDFLIANRQTRFLSDLTFPRGGTLFNAREIGHLRDVQRVTQWAFLLTCAAGVIALVCGLFLARRNRPALVRGLRTGALLAIGLVATVAVSAVAAWDTFFNTFHALLFSGGSWVFAYSDTLIRLFPEQFWFDAAITVGALTLAGALVLLIAAWLIQRTVRS